MKNLLLAMVLVGVALGAQAQSKVEAKETEPYKLAAKAGVKQCLAAVKGVSSDLIGDKKHVASCRWANKTPDTDVFSCNVELKQETTSPLVIPVLLTLTVSPTPDKTCTVNYTRTDVYPQGCKELRKDFFKQLENEQSPIKTMLWLKGPKGDGASYFFMPLLIQGCTVVKSETIFGATY